MDAVQQRQREIIKKQIFPSATKDWKQWSTVNAYVLKV